MKDRNYVISSYMEGEGFHTYSSVTEEQLQEVERILGTDFVDDISYQFPAQIKMVTDAQLKQSNIDGLVYDGYSKANAERMMDGLEPLETLE